MLYLSPNRVKHRRVLDSVGMTSVGMTSAMTLITKLGGMAASHG